MTSILNHQAPDKVELGMQAALCLGLMQRDREVESEARQIECLNAWNDIQERMINKYGMLAWADSVNGLDAQFPKHDWLDIHAPQVVWFTQNFEFPS